jgi:hypothetical protein
MKYFRLALVFLLVSINAPNLEAATVAAGSPSEEIAALRQLVEAMRQDYETRISDLEDRLASAERVARSAKQDANEAFEIAEQAAIDQSSGLSNANAYNPAIGAVLVGRYADIGTDWEEIPGFQPGGEIGTGESGFSLGEAEINLKGSIDSSFFGNLTVGLHDHEGEIEVELEEAWLQTTGLPGGIQLTAGRLFSSAGYLNNFHFHSDDFADRPLPYQAFLGGRYSVDGVQARWIAPASLLLELGTELNWGDAFPATANGGTSPGAWTAYGKIGGDIGLSNSWQLGLAHIKADAVERGGGHGHEEEEAHGEEADEHEEFENAAFTGDSDLTVVDFVWKWAPQGNSSLRNFKLQGEYFKRSEDGVYGESVYDGDQSGWYLQGVMQFAPRWRAGLRYDLVDADNDQRLFGTELEDPGRSSKRSSVMLDWSASEFSRIRVQYTRDEVLPETDHQWLVQYIISLGAHGAHQF